MTEIQKSKQCLVIESLAIDYLNLKFTRMRRVNLEFVLWNLFIITKLHGRASSSELAPMTRFFKKDTHR